MDIGVPSRFACLKIEEEERSSSNKPKKPVEKTSEKSKNQSQNKKSSSINTQNGKKQQNTSKKPKPKKTANDKQWEEWKKRDDALVDNNFEQQLHSAMLQSKLEFERQKKNAQAEGDSQGKKQKKAKTMSLDQFLEGDKETVEKESSLKNGNERDFFKEVMETTKQEIKRQKVEEERKKRTENFEEIVSLAQCQEKLEQERAKNEALQKELKAARDEITLVKKRNTTLCSMLSQGEMKDKAAVLLELERLTSVKEELTEEVSKLHKLLEQERSGKVSNSPDKVEKAERSDSSSKHNSKEKNKK